MPDLGSTWLLITSHTHKKISLLWPLAHPCFPRHTQSGCFLEEEEKFEGHFDDLPVCPIILHKARQQLWEKEKCSGSSRPKICRLQSKARLQLLLPHFPILDWELHSLSTHLKLNKNRILFFLSSYPQTQTHHTCTHTYTPLNRGGCPQSRALLRPQPVHFSHPLCNSRAKQSFLSLVQRLTGSLLLLPDLLVVQKIRQKQNTEHKSNQLSPQSSVTQSPLKFE